VHKDNLKWELNFLKTNDNVNITTYEGEILGIILPDKVALKILETEPAVKGDTANNAQKLAKLETGLEVKVPLFIEEGELVLVSTSDGKYSGRA
jgi:elongation factor P